jgi:hypothetical protein
MANNDVCAQQLVGGQTYKAFTVNEYDPVTADLLLTIEVENAVPAISGTGPLALTFSFEKLTMTTYFPTVRRFEYVANQS